MPSSAGSRLALALGLAAGSAGVGMLLWWRRRTLVAASPPEALSLATALDSAAPKEAPAHGKQRQILEKLDELLSLLEELREEVRELAAAVPRLKERVQAELTGRAPERRPSPQHRARRRRPTPTPSSGTDHSSEEGGYTTANTDTEEQTFPAQQALNTFVEELDLAALLQKVDGLRGSERGQLEGFELLCYHKEKSKDDIEFLWRLIRSYADMCEMSKNKDEKKLYANIGKTLGEKAVLKAPRNGHCHLWYAILCGHVSEFEGLQNKINYGHLFKEHLDRAIELLPEEPLLYYLKGRYCYTVSKLSWIERKMAATLFGKIPSSTLEEALENLLKAEDLSPGFSKCNYMYLAKCYLDLEQREEALKFCTLAAVLPCVTRADMDAEKEVKRIRASLKGANLQCVDSSRLGPLQLDPAKEPPVHVATLYPPPELTPSPTGPISHHTLKPEV